MSIEDIKKRVSEIRTIIHYLSIDNVNTLTTKQFNILIEVETKLNEFKKES